MLQDGKSSGAIPNCKQRQFAHALTECLCTTKEFLMARKQDSLPSVVLVHGGFVVGSGWQGVYDLLTEDGYDVSVVQNPTISLAADVRVTKRVLDEQNGSVVLVGH